jgi:hypothetical protein
MADPVSWLMIKPGWKVEAADGSPVGEVDEIAGDENDDIFDGLAIAVTALGRPRYVPSEKVAEITGGTVRLSLGHDEVEALQEYRFPPTSLEIDPDSGGGALAGAAAEVRSVVGDVVRRCVHTPSESASWTASGSGSAGVPRRRPRCSSGKRSRSSSTSSAQRQARCRSSSPTITVRSWPR